MSFCLQLRMILWKNYLLRRRNKVRCLVEVIWPIFLFLILLWVRTKNLRVEMHECHFTEKAMPSTGGLPFFQSFMCTYNNTCFTYINDAKVTTTINHESFLKFVNEVKQIINSDKVNQIKDTVDDVKELVDLIEHIDLDKESAFEPLSVPNLIRDSNSLKKEIKRRKLPLSSHSIDSLLSSDLALQSLIIERKGVPAYRENISLLLCNETLMHNIVNEREPDDVLYAELCKMSTKDVDNLLASAIKEMDTKDVVKQIGKRFETDRRQRMSLNDSMKFMNLSSGIVNNLQTLRTYSEIVDKIVNASSDLQALGGNSMRTNIMFLRLVAKFDSYMCGREAKAKTGDERSAFEPGNEPSKFDSLNERLKSKVEFKYEYDENVTKECNDLFQTFEESTTLKAIWMVYKPILRGKLLYTPKTKATERIMKKINDTFAELNKLRAFLNLTENVVQAAKSMLRDSAIARESMKKLINLSGRKGLVSLFIDNKTMDDYEEMEGIFEKYSNESMEDHRSEAIDDFYDIVKNLTLFLDCVDYDKIIDYPTENDAMVAGMKLLEVNRLIAVIVFEGQTSDDLTPFTTYKIRMSSDRVDDTDKLHDGMRRPGPRMRPFVDLKYITFGFAYLQDLLEHYMIIEHTGLKSEDLPGFYLQQFPYPCYVNDHFIVSISGTFPLLMVLSWVYSCAVIVKSIVYEKEQRLKETMHVMGLGNGVHWVGWFIDSLIPMLITIVLLTLILSYGNILRSSNPWIISGFLFVYCLATIGQAFLISVFFSKANIAAASGGLLFFVLYLPYALLMRWISFMSPIVKFLLCLSSNVAFGLGASYFSMFEEQGSGLQWKNINESPLYTDTYSLMIVMLILLLDFFLYLLLAWYIEGVAPGQYGIARPWYFPVTCSYWRGTRNKKVKNDYTEEINYLPKENCEPEPTSLTVGISIHNLSKVYPNGKTAVKGLTLNFYQDQITSFLGHNGAGKTTTISILTGLYPPSSGTAVINGMDIRTDMDTIRHSLGMCPQHNVLFDQLSVEEHLIFFSTLRGKRSKKEIRQEVEQMLTDLELPNKRKSLSSDLSGGMQRKLSIAIAFIGGSKTVILDEPTSGVDPYSRRKIWELLIKYKEGRTVVLTTHYMDEADLLGDRIAIISGGQLQCVGSSLFLKNRFGSGYYLTIDVLVLGKNQKLTQEPVQKIYVHIVSIIPSARLHDQIGTELIFILPVRSQVEELNRLFNSLEENKKLLRINSYGISDTSLEEIFLRVAENAELAASTNGKERAQEPVKTCCGRLKQLFRGERTRPAAQRSASVVVEIENDEIIAQLNGTNVKYIPVPVVEESEAVRPSGFKKWRQYKALMIKRFHHTRRRKKALLSELVLPAVFLCFTLLITNILPTINDRPPLVLKPSLYGSPRFIFETIENDTEPRAKLYKNSLLGETGLGMICCTNYSEYGPLDVRDNKCLDETTFYKGARNVSSFGEACSCETGNQVCPKNSGLPIPASTEIVSSELMYEFTNSNISDWILKTFRPYMKSNSMGGFNLAYWAPVPEVSLETIAKIIMLNKSDPEDFHHKENNIKIWYNNKGWATSVAYLNAVNNFVLRGSLPADKSQNASNYGIRAINHPMNYTRKQLNMEALQQNGLSVLHAVAVIFALSFVPASFTLYIIEDRVTNSKHLQLVSGLNRIIYWVSTYTWDMCCYTFVVFLCVMVFVAFGEDAYISERNLGAFVTLLMLYGISCTPLMYPLSFFFKVPSSSFVVLGCCNMFIGIITTLTTFVLSVFEDEELQAVNAVIKKVFLIFPHYCLGDGLMKLTTNYMVYYSYLAFDVEVVENNFAWNQLGRNYFFMAIFAVLYFIMTLLLEYEVFVRIHRLLRRKVKPDESTIINEDDVKAERARVKSGDTKQDTLVIDDLFKVYTRAAGKKPSVNQICAGMKQGECFGLLGLNGAGKTTTFKMLTGEIKANAGDAYVNGNSITKTMSKVRSHIGYCPQFDALDSSLTPSEHLYFYARLRNLPAKQVPSIVDSCLQRLGLTNYTKRCAGTLSGGNKRKLATAIAVLGSPPLIFLDEPTSGMDPRARRFLWSTVQTLVKEGHCVILTSHSMEECQALCTRLTIMVNGQFKCIGSSQHLKNKYGGGYSLTMHCQEGEANVTVLKNYIKQKLRKAVLREEHHTRLRYQLPPFSHQLPEVFSVMEVARKESIIIDYSLSQTTLEDVFIQFAMEQSEQEKQKNKIKLRSALHCSPCSRCCLGKQEVVNP